MARPVNTPAFRFSRTARLSIRLFLDSLPPHLHLPPWTLHFSLVFVATQWSVRVCSVGCVKCESVGRKRFLDDPIVILLVLWNQVSQSYLGRRVARRPAEKQRDHEQHRHRDTLVACREDRDAVPQPATATPRQRSLLLPPLPPLRRLGSELAVVPPPLARVGEQVVRLAQCREGPVRPVVAPRTGPRRLTQGCERV